MRKYFLILVAIGSILFTEAQNPLDIRIRNSTYSSDSEQFPFWFISNRNGKVPAGGSFLNLSEVYFSQNIHSEASSIEWTWGADILAGLSKENNLQVNQLFAGVTFRFLELKGGMFYDPLRFSGLSTTNGNFIRSQNARPYPMLRLSSGQNITVPLTRNILSFSFMYSEGLLNDERFVNNTRLHHKSFHLVINPFSTWEIKLGAEHSVMWGGTSSNGSIGQMPQGFKSYFRYILGSRGGNSFPDTDKMNVAGNQMGVWQFEIKKEANQAEATLYLNHPFEDFSGVNFRNWPDNLIGLHIRFKKGKTVSALLYEFTNTRQQSIRDSIYGWNEEIGQWGRNEFDNYFNHSVYRSGYTYHQMVIGSPLFFPLVSEEGISLRIRSNRFYAHHAGLAGNITSHLKWKGMLTYMKHFGTYTMIYETPLDQISGLLELNYSNHVFPFDLALSIAADKGSHPDLNRGISLTITKKL